MQRATGRRPSWSGHVPGRAFRCAAGFLAGAAIAIGATAVPSRAGQPLLKAGDEVPDLLLPMADGSDSKLSSREGSVVVLYFHGTWARKAPEQAKKLDELRKARAKQKFSVVGIARDGTRADAKKFCADLSLGFPEAADPKDELYARFAEKGLPWIAVVDEREPGKRTLRRSAAGFDAETLATALAGLLGKTDAEREREEREKAERPKTGTGDVAPGTPPKTPPK